MEQGIDIGLAVKCAEVFSKVVQVGCTVSDAAGVLLHESGSGCTSCHACALAGKGESVCMASHLHSVDEAQRFGGKYVYLCPMGFACFVTPIIVTEGCAANITVGPFLMVEPADYIACEVADMNLPQEVRAELSTVVSSMPYISPERIEPLSDMLFLAASGLSDVTAVTHMLAERESDDIQGEISAFLSEARCLDAPPEYSLKLEHELMDSITRSDRLQASKLLNQLLGNIFFLSGANSGRIRAHVTELLVLTSRAAIDGGADAAKILALNQRYLSQLQDIHDIDRLCYWLSDVLRHYVDSLFEYGGTDNLDVMPRALSYIAHNFDRKLTMQSVAEHVYLSPSYFSRLFKRETGLTFGAYLTQVRVERAKKLLASRDMPLTEVAVSLGFGDQSHFTRVFVKATGLTPGEYRRTKGRAKQ